MAVMIKLRLPGPTRDFESVQDLPGLASLPLDPRFGLVPIRPRESRNNRSLRRRPHQFYLRHNICDQGSRRFSAPLAQPHERQLLRQGEQAYVDRWLE